MPFEKVDKEWLKPFVENRENLLKEYNSVKDTIKRQNPQYHPEWDIIFLKDSWFGERKNYSKLPLLKSLMENIPDDIYLVLSMYSVIQPGMIGHFHSEPYPRENGYRRYHIPLQIPKGVRFEVEGEPLYDWEVGEVYEFTNPGTMHRILYPEGNKERVVFLIDVFEDHKPTKEELDYCYVTGSRFLEYSEKD